MNKTKPSCPDCGGSLFNAVDKFYCADCEKEFCPYCLHSIKNDANEKPCVHYVVTESDGAYFDLLDRMPDVFADEKYSVLLSDALSDLDEECLPFIQAHVEMDSTYYCFWYSEIGGDAVWERLLLLLEQDTE